MPDLPAVLFDVDGTLLDTNYLHVLAWWQAFEDTGRGPVATSELASESVSQRPLEALDRAQRGSA